jgi:hypothetical protein
MESIIAIPMYRVSSGKWEQEFEEKLDKDYGDIEGTEEQIKFLKDRARNRDYYHWKYNDVVGWIELGVYFNKVKGRIFIADKKRFTRWFHPKYKDNYQISIEVSISGKENDQITSDVIHVLHEWKNLNYKNRSIDYSHLRFVDWISASKVKY